MIFVSPFSIDLVRPGIQSVDPAFQQIGRYRQTIDLLLDSLARGGADHRITPSLRGIQLVEDTRPLAPADQDLVVDESFELTNRQLEMLLLTLLSLALIDKDGLVDCVV